jgi:predicted porin
MRPNLPQLFILLLLWSTVTAAASAQTPEAERSDDEANTAVTSMAETEAMEKQIQATETDVGTNEDPEAKRRAERLAEPAKAAKTLEFEIYGSARIHAINEFDPDTGDRSNSLGDGASRIGVSGGWHFREGWNLFGRLESGFDILDTFTPKAQNDEGGIFTPRLYNFGLESDSFYLKFGKSWSSYYQVAGAADRFAIFGGNGVGIYNAGTDGGATGTGRADNALQTLLYMDVSSWTGIKPFNLNVQYQSDEPVPRANGLKYGSTFSLSAWFETQRDIGVGLAWHRANIHEPERPEFAAVGITGDAQALAVAFKTYGDRWLARLVLARLENLETTNEFRYFDGEGAELFAQWEFHDKWWLIGGGNWLRPDDDSPMAGEYEVSYLVLGLRYTLDSFNRMLYAEWRKDEGTLADGTPNGDEFTVGLRWDFGL